VIVWSIGFPKKISFGKNRKRESKDRYYQACDMWHVTCDLLHDATAK
jgi:hypothetical protein